jgi:hypothetical protein
MSRRTAARLAWALWALAVILVTFDLLVSVVAPPTPPPTIPGGISPSLFIAINVLGSLLFLAFPTVGALVASRRPENPIGWLLCAMALTDDVRGAGQSYARYALAVHPGALPAGELVLWIAVAAFSFTIGLIVFVFLLFPDGRLPSRRWRPIAWLTAGAMAATFLVAAFAPWPPDEFVGNPRNPIRVAGWAGDVLMQLFPILLQFQFALFILAALSLILRFRRAHGPERQQLKWVTSAVAVASIVAFAFWLLGSWQWAFTNLWGYLAALLYTLALAAVPISIGIAILKHRLYDIDLIINRALVYGVLTATLALVYLSSVVVLQEVLRILAGQAQSELVTVASTLAIAALFTPLRRRIQATIDRRFYRRKYDAVQVLAAFSARLRDEVDLSKLNDDLLNVVNETMQPTHVSLWLRDTNVKRTR